MIASQVPDGSVLGWQDQRVAIPSDPRLSFNEAPDIYDAIRPSYPAPLFDALFQMLPPAPTIVEVGPGTGQATKDLLARGASVHAVEIGPRTASKLQDMHASQRLIVTVGDFESVELPRSWADALFSATAYHWISLKAQTDRPAFVLRPGGVLAIVDLIQVSDAADRGFFQAAQPIYRRHSEGHRGPAAPTRDAVEPPIEVLLRADGRFQDVAVRQWDWDQTYSAAGYRRLMLSYSGTQMLSSARRLALLDDVEAFINAEFDGRITRPLVVTLTTASLI